MHRRTRIETLAVLVLVGCAATPDYSRPLRPGAPALLELEPGDPRPDFAPQFYERSDILPPLDRSIAWTRKEYAQQFFPIAGISHDRALRSLVRFREILENSSSAAEFDALLERDFTVYKSAGWNSRGGGVLFTGYCTPILPGNNAAHRGVPLPALRVAAGPREGRSRRDPRPALAGRRAAAVSDAAGDRGRRAARGPGGSSWFGCATRSMRSSRTSTGPRSSSCRAERSCASAIRARTDARTRRSAAS